MILDDTSSKNTNYPFKVKEASLEDIPPIKHFPGEPQTTTIHDVRAEKLSLERILSKDQRDVLERDSEIEKISLAADGKINLPQTRGHVDDEGLSEWRSREGIIDAKMFHGASILIYNAHTVIPEGCPNLREKNRSAEYDPYTKTCYVDLSDSYDFLDYRYRPEWIQQYVRHELRHHLVAIQDQKYGEQIGQQERRNVDWDHMNKRNPEGVRQLAYLDELHSQYFDALEGEIDGRDCFRKSDSRIYSVADSGPHIEVASQTPEGKAATKELFYFLQGMLLLKRMSEQKKLSSNTEIETLTKAAGVVLATERSVTDAKTKVELTWKEITSNPETHESFKDYLATYVPESTGMNNTPEITEELRKTLNLNS